MFQNHIGLDVGKKKIKGGSLILQLTFDSADSTFSIWEKRELEAQPGIFYTYE